MVPQLSERTFTRLFTMIVYFSSLELGLGASLKTVLALAPSPRSVANWIRWGASIDDYLTTQDLKRARGVFVSTDAGEAANMKRQMTALTFWDFGLNRPRFVPADCMAAGSGGLGAAKNVHTTLLRLMVERAFGGTTDSAPEVLSVMPRELQKLWPDYKIVVGCVLHILNLILVAASLNAFGDEAMGVCGALRLAYVVHYLQKKYVKHWSSFLETTSAGPEFKAIVPSGSKGRWWSLAVAWGCILRDPGLYSDFFMQMANDTAISDTFRTMLRETSAWLVTPLKRARGVFVSTDAGEAANMKRQMTALTYWDFGLSRPRFVPADCMAAGSGGKGAAKNVHTTLLRLQAERAYGGTTDSAPEVLCVMPRELRKLWPDYKIVVGCVLHILNLILVAASLNAFGDEAMGVCGALRLAYVVNYLQKKYAKDWASFLETTSAGSEFAAIVPSGSKGRWWSLAVAWGCILRDPGLYSNFFMQMANDTAISDTFRSMLKETSAWLVTPKALTDMQFQLCFTQDLKRARGVFVSTDAGEAANMKRQMTALTFWDFGLNRPRFVPADCMAAGSGGLGAAKNVHTTLLRLMVERAFGGTTDSAPEVLSVMPRELQKLWPDYKIVVGCVLHILNLILVAASLNAFGDEAMGVCGALRLAYVVNYLQKKYAKHWASFLETTSAGPEFKAIVPSGSKGRWWSLAVAWGCILRDPGLYSNFFMQMANDTAISDTFRTMLKETSAWLVTPKALTDMQFQLCFILTYWAKEMNFAQEYPEWMNGYPDADKVTGMRAAEYSVRVVISHLHLCSQDPEADPGYASYRAQRDCCTPEEQRTSRHQAALYLSTAVVVKEKHHERWLRILADLSVAFPDKILRSFIVARFIARYDGLPDPEIPAGTLVEIWGEKYELQVILDHLTQFIDSTSLRENSSLMHDIDFVESMRVAASHAFDEEKSGSGGALYYAMIRAIAYALSVHTHGIEKLVQTSNLFTKKYSSREREDRVPSLLYDRVESQDDWLAAVVSCRDTALTPSVRVEANDRSLKFRPGSVPLAKQLHRTNNKTVVEAFITNFESKLDLITGEVVEAAGENASVLEDRGNSRRASLLKRERDDRKTSSDAVAKSRKRSTAFNEASRAKLAASSSPVVPVSFSGQLFLEKTKSADFGAPHTRDTLIAECTVRGIKLERGKDGVVKSTVTIKMMKDELSKFHSGDLIIPRMTVDGSARGSAFLGTREWSVPPEACEGADVGQGSDVGLGSACSTSVPSESSAASSQAPLSSVAALPTHANGSPGIAFPPAQPPSSYTSGSEHVPIPSMEGEYQSPQFSVKKHKARMAIRSHVSAFHDIREPVHWGMRKARIAPGAKQTK
eukprot:CAMPEP_0185790860 /NCGR_PEP_ID=MMETSP1174-20130828/158039_1 /TAXON_ID=35687 /ORGANISM="Dictyocha speculum, Strain CCMP1381" /LENGTH=1350 /DNA_ID=CAMNT_0028485721 /DNA_START=70 /DNA_END=4122 /DNA_ORIENTATION=+